MRMLADCLACLAVVRLRDVQKLFKDESSRMEVMRRVLGMIYELAVVRGIESSPRVATAIFRWLKSVSGVEDPYRDEKRLANERALQMFEKVREWVMEGGRRERIAKALTIAALGNALDLGVAVYTPPSVEEIISRASTTPLLGVEEAIDAVERARRVLVVMDNAGEAVFDRALGEVLQSMGKEVIAVVKGGAFQNDVTRWEIDECGLRDSFSDVIDSGTDAASIFLEEVSPKLREALEWSDLVVSKGMANYEYISDVIHEIRKPVLYLLMAKCRPIAYSLGVEQGSIVAKLEKALS